MQARHWKFSVKKRSTCAIFDGRFSLIAQKLFNYGICVIWQIFKSSSHTILDRTHLSTGIPSFQNSQCADSFNICHLPTQNIRDRVKQFSEVQAVSQRHKNEHEMWNVKIDRNDSLQLCLWCSSSQELGVAPAENCSLLRSWTCAAKREKLSKRNRRKKMAWILLFVLVDLSVLRWFEWEAFPLTRATGKVAGKSPTAI